MTIHFQLWQWVSVNARTKIQNLIFELDGKSILQVSPAIVHGWFDYGSHRNSKFETTGRAMKS